VWAKRTISVEGLPYSVVFLQDSYLCRASQGGAKGIRFVAGLQHSVVFLQDPYLCRATKDYE